MCFLFTLFDKTMCQVLVVTQNLAHYIIMNNIIRCSFDFWNGFIITRKIRFPLFLLKIYLIVFQRMLALPQEYLCWVSSGKHVTISTLIHLLACTCRDMSAYHTDYNVEPTLDRSGKWSTVCVKTKMYATIRNLFEQSIETVFA